MRWWNLYTKGVCLVFKLTSKSLWWGVNGAYLLPSKSLLRRHLRVESFIPFQPTSQKIWKFKELLTSKITRNREKLYENKGPKTLKANFNSSFLSNCEYSISSESLENTLIWCRIYLLVKNWIHGRALKSTYHGFWIFGGFGNFRGFEGFEGCKEFQGCKGFERTR